MANVTQKIQTFLGGVSRKADFDKLQGQVVEANNCYPDETYGMIKRPGTELLGTLGIDYDTANGLYFFPLIREGQPRYLVGIGDGTIRMWNLDNPSTAITVNTPNNSADYLDYTSITGVNVNDAYRYASDDRRTVIVNRTKTAAENTTLWSTGIDSDGDGDIDPFTWTIRKKNQVANSIDDLPDGRAVRVHVTGGGNGSSTRPLREGTHYLPVTVDEFDNQGNRIFTEGSGLVIKCQVNAQGFIDSTNLKNCEIWAAGSGYPDQCPASIDGIPNSRLTIATGLQVATVYTVVNSNADNDDLYVQAFSNESTADDEPGYVPGPRSRIDGPYLWKECPSPEAHVGLDVSTLPHELIQVNSTTFTFQPIDYAYRWAGDNTNNPAPSFVGKTINNAFFMNNRLGFLSEDNVILSRPINYGPENVTPADYVPADNPWVRRNYHEVDFFRQSAVGLNDADPIDLKAANNDVSIFHTTISTPQGTILFADGQQSLLFQPQGLLSPLTASINSLSNYDMTGDINAVIVGEKYYFVNKSNKYCRIYSMINQGMQNPPVIEDVTKEVADWLPNDLTNLIACTTDNMIFVFNRERREVYVRREIGDGSSWIKWTHAQPVVHMVVDHDQIYFLTGSGDDIQVSVARLYLLPDDYTLSEIETAYEVGSFTGIPTDYNYYSSIIGETTLNEQYTGVLEYFKPWHNYYGDLSKDNSLDDTFDQWLPWEDTTPVNAILSVSADESAATEEQPWSVGFKICVRNEDGDTVLSPGGGGTYILPYDTKFRLRNTTGLPDATAFDQRVARCGEPKNVTIHVGTDPPEGYERVRYVGRFSGKGSARSDYWTGFKYDGDTFTTTWIYPNLDYTSSGNYTGDRYLYVGGVVWDPGNAGKRIIDHDVLANQPSHQVAALSEWQNYNISSSIANGGPTEFGTYATDGRVNIPWRSACFITTRDRYGGIMVNNIPFYLGGIGGIGFTSVPKYANTSTTLAKHFEMIHTGREDQLLTFACDGYWEFEKNGRIIRWGGYGRDGTLRPALNLNPSTCTDLAPVGCSKVDPANPGQIEWRDVNTGQGNYIVASAIEILDVYMGVQNFPGTGDVPYWIVKYKDPNGNILEGYGPRNQETNGVQEQPRESFEVFFATGTCLATGLTNQTSASDVDQCCNNIWVQNTDGTEFDTGIRAKSLEIIPDGDEVILQYKPCTTSTFDPSEYLYGKFVGTATVDGIPTNHPFYGNEFVGTWIDSNGNISTDWLEFNNFLNLGNSFWQHSGNSYYEDTYALPPQLLMTDSGSYTSHYTGLDDLPSTWTNSWTPVVNYVQTRLYSPDFGTQYGSALAGNKGVAWRNTIEARIEVLGGYANLDDAYVGGIAVDDEFYEPYPTGYPLGSTNKQGFGVRVPATHDYTVDGVKYTHTGPRTVKITGRWEFTNNTEAGAYVSWAGIDLDGNSSTDIVFMRRYPASTFKTAYIRILETACCGCPTDPEDDVATTVTLNTLSLDPNMDLYTTNVTVSGTTITPPAGFPKLLTQKMSYVIANLPGTTAVASDRAGDTGTLEWNDDFTLTADSDLSEYGSSLIIGYRFDYSLLLPTFYYNQGNSDYDYTASLTVSRVKFALGLSGQADFEIKTRNGPDWEGTYSQALTNEYIASTSPLSEPLIVSVPIHKRNSDFQLQVKSDSPFPLSVDSCMWEGNYSPRYYRRT